MVEKKKITNNEEFIEALKELRIIGERTDFLLKEINDFEEMENLLKDYDYLPNSAITQFIKNKSITSNSKVKELKVNKNANLKTSENLETGQLEYNYISNTENFDMIFNDLNKLINKSHIYLRKTLNFILIKANDQNRNSFIYFDIEEYMKATGYKTKDTAVRGAKRNLDTLMGIIIGGTVKKGKELIRAKASYIFTAYDVSYNQCFIECKPDIVEMLSQYFTLLPKWAGELNTKAYDLLDYIFYMARQTQNTINIRKNKSFNISFKSINEYIGGYTPENTRRHAEYIIDPILNAIDEIEDIQRGERLYVTPIYNHDYKNIYEFLEGYIQVELGEEATIYFCDRNKDREKKRQKAIKK